MDSLVDARTFDPRVVPTCKDIHFFKIILRVSELDLTTR